MASVPYARHHSYCCATTLNKTVDNNARIITLFAARYVPEGTRYVMLQKVKGSTIAHDSRYVCCCTFKNRKIVSYKKQKQSPSHCCYCVTFTRQRRWGSHCADGFSRSPSVQASCLVVDTAGGGENSELKLVSRTGERGIRRRYREANMKEEIENRKADIGSCRRFD